MALRLEANSLDNYSMALRLQARKAFPLQIQDAPQSTPRHELSQSGIFMKGIMKRNWLQMIIIILGPRMLWEVPRWPRKPWDAPGRFVRF